MELVVFKKTNQWSPKTNDGRWSNIVNLQKDLFFVFVVGVITPSHQPGYTCSSCYFPLFFGELPMDPIISGPNEGAYYTCIFIFLRTTPNSSPGGGGGGGGLLHMHIYFPI